MKKWMTLKALVTLLLIGMFTSLSAQEIKKKNGRVKLKHPNGVVMAKGKVRNHKRQGEWKFWDDKGVLAETVEFTKDTMNGVYTRYAADGKVFESGRYHMGKKDGEWNLFFSDGTKALSAKFKDGEMDGEQLSWYNNGKIRERDLYVNNIIQSREAWYDNGRPRLIETYADGLPHGTWTTYPIPMSVGDTIPETIDDYDHGKRNGRHILNVGSIMVQEFYYKDDVLHGVCKRWDRTGQLESIEPFEKGLLEGTCKYYKNGSVLRTVQFHRGLKNGEELDFDRSERKLQSTWYSNGDADSIIAWFPNGRMASKKINSQQQFGKPRPSSYTEWDSAGVKLQEGYYSGSQRAGKWTTYYPNGKVRSVTNYAEGRVNGLFTKWYQNGKKMIEMHVFENGLNTPPDVWDEKGKIIKIGTKAYNEIVEGNKPGEIFNDPSMYQRPIIDRRVEDGMPDQEGEIFDTEIGGTDKVLKAIDDPNLIYDYPEIAPAFPGGDSAMMNFIARNIQYPPIARDMQKQGTVYVKFVVETNGVVSNVQVVRDVQGAPEFSAEAIRIVHLFPPFVAGRNNGKAVRSSRIVPVKFILR
jgi:hypothetical protein